MSEAGGKTLFVCLARTVSRSCQQMDCLIPTLTIDQGSVPAKFIRDAASRARRYADAAVGCPARSVYIIDAVAAGDRAA